jgi:hypothetical protein
VRLTLRVSRHEESVPRLAHRSGSVWGGGHTVLNKTTAKKSLSLDTMLCRGSSEG